MSCRWKISVIGEVVVEDLDLKVEVEEDERRRGVDEEELDVAYIGNREYSPRDMASLTMKLCAPFRAQLALQSIRMSEGASTK